LRNFPGSKKKDFVAEVSDFRSSIKKLSNYLDNFLEEIEIEEDEEIEIEKDEEWNFHEDTFISVSYILLYFFFNFQGCTKNNCEDFSTLSEAKTKCKLSDDCFGITNKREKYQLRAGPGTFSSSTGEKSWLRKGRRAATSPIGAAVGPLRKIEQCHDELEGENRINIGNLENSYKELKNQRFRVADGTCLYRGNFYENQRDKAVEILKITKF
jgi:hypothetical protein